MRDLVISGTTAAASSRSVCIWLGTAIAGRLLLRLAHGDQSRAGSLRGRSRRCRSPTTWSAARRTPCRRGTPESDVAPPRDHLARRRPSRTTGALRSVAGSNTDPLVLGCRRLSPSLASRRDEVERQRRRLFELHALSVRVAPALVMSSVSLQAVETRRVIVHGARCRDRARSRTTAGRTSCPRARVVRMIAAVVAPRSDIWSRPSSCSSKPSIGRRPSGRR